MLFLVASHVTLEFHFVIDFKIAILQVAHCLLFCISIHFCAHHFFSFFCVVLSHSGFISVAKTMHYFENIRAARFACLYFSWVFFMSVFKIVFLATVGKNRTAQHKGHTGNEHFMCALFSSCPTTSSVRSLVQLCQASKPEAEISSQLAAWQPRIAIHQHMLTCWFAA